MVLGTLSVPCSYSLGSSSQSCAHLSPSQCFASKGYTGKLCGSLAGGYWSGLELCKLLGAALVWHETVKAQRPCLE